MLKTAWPYEPALNDHEADVWWHLRGVTPESATFDKLKALAPLAPILAKMAHLEAATMLEGLKDRLRLRAKDLSGLAADVKQARRAQKKKGDAAAPALNEREDVRRLHPAIDFYPDFMSIGFRVDLPENDTGLLLVISDAPRVGDNRGSYPLFALWEIVHRWGGSVATEIIRCIEATEGVK